MRAVSEHSQAYPFPTLQEQTIALPRLDGWALGVARFGWIALFCLALLAMVASFPGYLLKFNGMLAHATTDQLGSSGRIFAAASGIASLASALLSIALALMLFRQKFVEPAAAALAYYLLAYAVIMAGPLEHLGAFWFGSAAFATVLQAILMSTPTIALFALFPNGRFVPTWMRWVLIASIPWGISIAFQGPISGDQVQTDSANFTVQAVLFSIFVLIGIYAQVYRYRRVSTPDERQQTKWVVLGFALWLAWILISTGPYLYLTGLPEGSAMPWWAPVSEFGWWLSLSLLPLSLSIALTRFNLWNLDFVVNRALVFGGVTTLSIAVYGLVILGLGWLFEASDSTLVPLIATGVAVLTFQPLRTRLQAIVNRMMYGERDDPISVLSKLGEQLEQTATPDSTLKGIVETIAHALKLPYAGIILGSEGSIAASVGEEVENLVRLPLIYQGQAVGVLLVAPRSPHDPLTGKDYQLLENISRQASAVAYNAVLTSDLQQARQHLVTMREEERRRIRRDLHDGLGPQLASLTLKLDASRNLLSSKPQDAEKLLLESKVQVQDAVADIRRLVYDLRPPALDELGLMSTLRERAATNSAEKGPQTYIEGPETLPNLPAAVEVAVYRIVQEAINNAAQHGQAKHCWVRVEASRGLHLEIEDDGVGIAKDYRSGVGITSMRERTAELGGTFEIISQADSGTLISVWLPL